MARYKHRSIATFLFTGDFEPDYNRTRILRRGLEALGHTVTELRYSRKRRPVRAAVRAAAAGADVIFLPSFTHADVRFTKRCLPDRRLIFDPLISRYLTKVHDYRQVHRWSPRAWKNRWKDRRALAAADLVLTDTEAHAAYFHREYDIPACKFRTLYIGAESDLFYPAEFSTTGTLRIGFYGAFAPLQGVETILRAAHLLRDRTELQWEIIGSGFDYTRCRRLATALSLPRLTWRDWLPFAELPGAIRSYDICLGIFGESLKTDLVIPNKIYHYAACGKPVITADTAAVRELFIDRKNILLCQKSPEDLARKVLQLLDPAVRATIGDGAAQVLQGLGHRAIARRFLQALEIKY